MKRNGKILVLLLSLALIVGVFAVTALAADDVKTVKSADFEGATVGVAGAAADNTNPKVDGITFQQGGRWGTVEVVDGNGDNKYVLLTQESTAANAKSEPYLYFTTGGNASLTDGVLNKGANDISNYKYIVYEFDFMSPTGNFINANVNPYFASIFKDATSRNFWYSDATKGMVRFGNDEAGSYIYPNYDTTRKLYVNPYEFNHVQVIMENTSTTTGGTLNIGINTRIYVNGKLWLAKSASNITNNSGTTALYYNDEPHVAMTEFRIYYEKTVDPTKTLAIDNLKVYTVPAGSSTTYRNLLSYSASKIPVGEYVAEVNGEKFDNLADAVSAAPAGSTVTLLNNYLTEVTVDKALTVVAGDYKVNLTAADGLAISSHNGKYTIGDASNMGYAYVSGGATVYAAPDVPFANIIKAADAGSTVKILRDIVDNQTGTISIDKALTVDLDGNTVKFNMLYKTAMFNVKTTSPVTFKNGTVVAEITAEQKQGMSYMLFYTATSGASIVLENMNVYTGVLYQSVADGAVNLTVSGGKHYSTVTSTDLVGGYVESRGNINFTANGASFYISKSGNGILGSMSYKTTTAAAASTFTFTDCDIIAEDSSVSLIRTFNGNSKVYFNNCDVVGSINPTKHSFDSSSPAIASGSVILGAGTRIGAQTLSSAVAVASGYVLSDYSSSASKSFDIPSGKLFDGSFTTKSTNVTAYFSKSVTKTMEGTLLTYVSGGDTVAVKTGESFDVSELIAKCDAGSTITFYADCTLTLNGSESISRNITIDFNSHTVIFAQSYKISEKDSSYGRLSITGGYTVTLKNGTVIAQYKDELSYSGSTIGGKSYTLFNVTTNSVLNLENVNTYTGMLAQNYNGNNPKVNVNGGTHYLLFSSTDVGHGFVESRNNITFTANNAIFYFAGGNGLLASQHYNSSLAESALKSTFTYNNCKIIANSSGKNLITTANEFTFVTFNGCDVFGSINPSVGSSDKDSTKYSVGAMLDGSIKIGEGTRLSSVGLYSAALDKIADGRFVVTDKIPYAIKVRLLTGAVYSDDIAILAESEAAYVLNVECIIPTEYTVTWYKEDGKTVIKTETVSGGEVVTPPSYAVGTTNNGWFKSEGYDGWTNTFGGAKVTDFTVNGDTSFYPAPSNGVTAHLVGARYNLSFVGDIKINLYVPIAPEGITVNSVTAGGTTVYPTRVLLGSTPYNYYEIASVKANKLTTAVSVAIKYTVGGKTITQNVSLSAANYANTILLDSAKAKPNYPASAHEMVANMVRYSNELCKLVSYATNGTAKGDTTLEALLASYGSLCTELPGSLKSDSDISALTGYVSSATLDLSTMQPKYLFSFNTAANEKVIECYVTMQGYLDKTVNGANYGTVTYKAKPIEYVDGTDYIAKAYIGNIPMYNITNTVTVKVVLENGISKTGTYNLGAYYNGVSTSDATQLSLIKTVVESLWVFGESAAEYRHADIKIDEANAKSFWSCSHSELATVNLTASEAKFPVSVAAKYCAECNNYFIYYKDFGAIGNGVSNGLNSDGTANVSGANDFAAVREAHTVANTIAAYCPDINVVVVGEGLEGNTFYMGYPDDGGTSAITVKTSVDWGGAHFIIDDTTVSNKDNTYDAYKQAIFFVTGDDSIRGKSVTANIPNGIAQGATNIGWAPGRPLMLQITLKSVKHDIRFGPNANSGQAQTEMILVDADGNVDPTTPVQWDYTNADYCTMNVDKTDPESWVITKCDTVDSDKNGKCDTCNTTITKAFTATAYSADDKPIYISGYNEKGEIDFVWETITNMNVDVSGYDQVQRNIKVTRSNVTLQGFDRVFVEDNSKDNKTSPRQAYAGYIATQYAYNTVIKDMKVHKHLGHSDLNGVSLGSYEYSGGNSINTSWINCVQKNFFIYNLNNDGNYIRYGGNFGTNYMRNCYLGGCVLSSFDAHSGLYNVTIENSTFDHINLVGGGDAIIRNVVVYAEANAGVCQLRQDYGSMWKGNIMFDGIQLRHDSNHSDKIELIEAYYKNHYFGFDTYQPTKIYVNNLSILQYKRTSESYTHQNGIVDESSLTKSTKPLYVYATVNSNMANNYDYSTVNPHNRDPKTCTEAIYFTNTDVEIKYPDHPFFKDMKVYVDGVEKNWYTERSNLKFTGHTDKDGNKACDVCGISISCSASHPTSGNSTQTCSTCKATVSKSGSSLTCVAEGTLITLADGSVKPIELLAADDMILVFNHYTGELAPSYIIFSEANAREERNVINLVFSDGTTVGLVYEHGLFDLTLNKYVYFTEEHYAEFVGHEFALLKDGKNVAVTLTDAYITTEYTACYSINTGDHFNYYVNGLLSVAGGIYGTFNIFEYADNLAFDEEKMQADIEKYGLYTYDDFKEYLDYESWCYYETPAKYFSVAVGKGLVTFEEILSYIQSYL